MTRLIEADELFGELCENLEEDEDTERGWVDIEAIVQAFNHAPTVDAEPVRYGRWKKAEPHGVWVYSDAYRQCSECNAVIYRALKMNYCPNCGSRMVGGEW